MKWNKVNSKLLATAHDGDIRIWDPRVSRSELYKGLGKVKKSKKKTG